MPTSQREFDPATLDVASPEHYEQHGYPHAEWTWLRRNAPVFWYDRPNVEPFWAITKHADIVEIGKNPTDWIIQPRIAVFARDVPVDMQPLRHLLSMDPPEHRDYRAVTAKQFTPRMVQQWEPKVQRITRRILDESSERGECDFVQDVSAPITIAVIAEMLGLPGDVLFHGLLLRLADRKHAVSLLPCKRGKMGERVVYPLARARLDRAHQVGHRAIGPPPKVHVHMVLDAVDVIQDAPLRPHDAADVPV